MLSTEFCYWLQGYFELSSSGEMNTRIVDLVEKHLRIVDAVDQKPSETLEFCEWLSSFLREMDDHYLFGGDNLSRSQIRTIKDKLNNIFEHVIDQSYPGTNQVDLNTLHGNDQGGPLMRC